MHFNLYLLTTKSLNRMSGLMFRFGLSIVSVPLACSPASAGGWSEIGDTLRILWWTLVGRKHVNTVSSIDPSGLAFDLTRVRPSIWVISPHFQFCPSTCWKNPACPMSSSDRFRGSWHYLIFSLYSDNFVVRFTVYSRYERMCLDVTIEYHFGRAMVRVLSRSVSLF